MLTSKPARSLRGTVLDATTKAPISYAGVALLANATTTIVCDANGRFAFDDVQEEMATLKAWHENYPTQQFSIFVPPAGATDAVLAL
ncbi:MAG: carboxypeptidase regulatory-like domain-containing protein, partial [bacterium]|nr:carboxypeptidase regulatory-like domain-containing protein [bacterium]